MEIVDWTKPKYHKIDGMGDGPMKFSLRSKQWGYWRHDLSGQLFEDSVVRVTPGNKVNDDWQMFKAKWYKPGDESPTGPRRAILWSLGRFFLASRLEKVTSVEESADGRLVVFASGTKWKNQTGRWEFEIDPAAAWMVRKAKFYSSARPDQIAFEMKNEGTKQSGSYCIPEKAEINLSGPIGDVTTR